MKKIVLSCILSTAVLSGMSFVAEAQTVIPVKEKSSIETNCTPSETTNYSYYLEDDGGYTYPADDFWVRGFDALILNGSNGSSIDIWRNGDVLTKCNTWRRMSNVVKNGDKVVAFQNQDKCVFNIPSYTKENNPDGIDAQIHFTIGYRKVRDGGPTALSNQLLFYKYRNESNYHCYPNGNSISDANNCSRTTVNVKQDNNTHVGECQNYRLFRCGDGLVSNSSTKYSDGSTHIEACDPVAPEWKNRTDGKSCNASCEIEYGTPECSSEYNNKKVYTTNSTPYLKGLDSENLCNLGKLTQNTFRQVGTPIQFTWGCTNGTQSTSSDECKFEQYRCGDGQWNGGGDWSKFINGAHYEVCDPTAPEWKNRSDGKSCSSSCTIIEPEDPICSSTYKGTKYTSTSEHWLKSTDNLCDSGEVVDFDYTPKTGGPRTYTWNCKIGTKKTNPGCEAKQERCGDGVRNGGEQCDYNDSSEANWGTDGCSTSCQPITSVSTGCDETFYYTLRQGEDYTFWDIFNAEDADRRLYGNPVVKFIEQRDFNRGPNPTFRWTNRNSEKKVSENTSEKVVESTPKYHIYDHPDKRSYDNLYIEYDLQYANRSNAPESRRKTHKECVYYEISRCGDGILDSEYGEKCDPNDPNKEGWGNGGCDKETCTPTNVKVPVCNSQYNGQVVENLTENDNLCSEGTYVPGSLHFNETTNTWTWECDNVAGEGVNCSATKKAKDGRLEPLKTLIGTNKVTKVGDEIIWSLKVTAKDGDVSDFIMSDTMPPVLGYKDYEVLHKGSVDSITFLGENKQNNSVSWKVSGTLKQNDYVEIKLITYAKEMPKKEEVNVLCVRPENEENNKECDDKKIPPVCNSDYNGQTLDELPSEDELCNVGKATTPKYDEKTQRWTWNCVEDGETVGCWARKEGSKTQTGRLEPLKTLIGPKEIHSTGDEITWSLKVTAKDGDVSDFIMSDTMPPVLGYKDYEVLHKGSVDSITFLGENKQNNSVSWKVSGTLKEEDYVEIRLITYAKEMPDKEEKNVLCVRPENEENNKKCDEKPIYSPKLRIKKSFTEGDNGKIVKIGDKIGYKIEFGNNGDASATITSIKDFLPKNVEYITGKIYLDTDSEHEKQESGSEIIDIKRGVPHIAKTVDGVRVDIYTGITLEPGQNGYIILTGEVKGEFTGSRTNFACIYLDNKKIDCDDVTHNITPEEVMCKKPTGTTNFTSKGGSTVITCETSPKGETAKIELDCGNGQQKYTKEGVSVLTGECIYPENNGNEKKEYTVSCKVNDKTNDDCKDKVIVNKPGGGNTPDDHYCKAPVKSGNEFTCESTDEVYAIGIDCEHETGIEDVDKEKTAKNGKEILSVTTSCNTSKEVQCYVMKNSSSKWETKPNVCNWTPPKDPGHGGCTNCGTDVPDCSKMTEDERSQDPGCNFIDPDCFNINNGNISIERTEYLPYYFNIRKDKNTDYTYEYINDFNKKCEDKTVALNSMKCKYIIRDPYNKIVFEEDDVNCLEEHQPTNDLINRWIDWMFNKYGEMFSIGDDVNTYKVRLGYTHPDKWRVGTETEWNKNGSPITVLGEYKSQVEMVTFSQCIDGEWQEKKVGGACQSNFVLTEPYTVQKTPSGNLKASTTTLSKFKQVDGKEITSFSDYLNAMSTTDYNKNSKVDDAMKNFRDKYEKLAVNVNSSKYKSLKKVPGKNIYFINENFEIKEGNFNKAFTIVQKGETNKVTIDRSVGNLNMMILTDGTIEFKGNCTSDQTVKGIFVGGTLRRDGVYKNDKEDLRHSWCDKGGLHIKGVLIGGGFENLMKDSRSHLDSWRISNSERSSDLKKKVMDGASVVIEYSPSIFTQSTMPPGAEYFTTALDIYKK